MEIETLVKKMKDINSALIDFIEADEDCETTVNENHKIFQNIEEIRLLFQLISRIADNHHRKSDFFDKLENFFSIFN